MFVSRDVIAGYYIMTSYTVHIPYAMDLGGEGRGRCRACDTNLTGSSPADQFQRLRIIQHTVRVPSSLYTMARGSLAAYQQAGPATHGVCWNQQSDRVLPSVARATVPSGATSAAVSHKGGGFGWGGAAYTQTASRPGAQTPGGVGCDIKHNSYARRLARLKARAPLKQEGIPVNFGGELPFNLAFPVWGGKTMKTGLIAGCACPPAVGAKAADLYRGGVADLYQNITITLAVGDFVYAIYPGDTGCYSKATVIGVNGDGTFLIEFADGTVDTQALGVLRMYHQCSTVENVTTATEDILVEGFINEIDNVFNANCIYPNNAYLQELLS